MHVPIQEAERKLGQLTRDHSVQTEELRALRAEADLLRNREGRSVVGKDGKDSATYDVLTQLENALKAKSREVDILHDEAKGLQSQLRAKDKAIAKLTVERNEQEGNSEVVVRLQSQVKVLTKQVADLTAENRVMERSFLLKAKQFEKQASDFQARPQNDDLITSLQNQLKAKDRVIRDLEDDRKTLAKVSERKSKQLVQTVENAESSFTGKGWLEERRTLLSELSSEKEKRATLEKSLKASNSQLATMASRIDFMAELQRKASHPRRLPSSPNASHLSDAHASTTAHNMYLISNLKTM